MIKIKSTMPERPELNWQLSKFCENNCHYCTSWDAKKTIKNNANIVEYSDEELEIAETIFHHINELDNIIIQMYGGEPTLHPKGVEYFNRLCKGGLDKPNRTLFLVTHGNIDEEKIESLDSHGNDNHLLSISYHHHQVKDFNAWLKKIKNLNKKLNCMVSAIIPRNKRRKESLWAEFEEKMLQVEDCGIELELKLELDKYDLTADSAGIMRFSNMIERVHRKNKHISDMFVVISDETTSYKLNILDTMVGVPITYPNTLCNNNQFTITQNNILSAGCSMGSNFEIKPESTIDEIISHMKLNSSIMCGAKTCSENRHQMDIKIFNKNLNDTVYADFVKKIVFGD